MKSLKMLAVFVAILLFADSSVFASGATTRAGPEPPEHYIEKLTTKILETVREHQDAGKTSKKELVEMISQKVERHTRPHETAKAIAGRHWKEWVRDGRDVRFVETLKKYLLCSYADRIIEYADTSWSIISSSQKSYPMNGGIRDTARVSVLFTVSRGPVGGLSPRIRHEKTPEQRYIFEYYLRREGAEKDWWIYNLKISSGLSFNFIVYLRNEVARLLSPFRRNHNSTFDNLIAHYERRTKCK